LCGTDY
jgi:hypothetical protein